MICIIQNGFIDSNINLYLNKEYIIYKSYQVDVSMIDVESFDIFILLGGYQSVNKLDMYPYLKNVIHLISKLDEKKIPLLGICLGCELIAKTFGCTIKPLNEGIIDYNTKIVFENISYENIFRYHYDYIVENDKIDVLYKYNNIPYLIQKNKCIGIQCHPDIPPEHIQKYINNFDINYNISKTEINETNKKLLIHLITYLLKLD